MVTENFWIKFVGDDKFKLVTSLVTKCFKFNHFNIYYYSTFQACNVMMVKDHEEFSKLSQSLLKGGLNLHELYVRIMKSSLVATPPSS